MLLLTLLGSIHDRFQILSPKSEFLHPTSTHPIKETKSAFVAQQKSQTLNPKP